MNTVTQVHEVGALEEYARLKLELAAIVRAILHTAERRKDEIAIGECRRLLGRLAEDRFNLAVLGQFSRGKSSLMNALLGAEKLPTGILPLTSVITTVAYGESERVLLQRAGWTLPQEIGLEDLPEYITQNGNPGNEKRVTLAQIQLPHEILRLGVHFIDTPGVASAIRANTRTTRQFLPEADAAILVTSFESPMTEPELSFLKEIRSHVRRVFVVVNKQDLVAPAHRGAVLEAVRESLREVFEEDEFDLFAVSARDALIAKQGGSAVALESSGLSILEAALTKFLRTDKARELLLRAADRAASLARQQEVSIRISQRARAPEQAAVLEQRLHDCLAAITSERDATIQRLANRLRLRFPRRCEERIGLWSSEAEIYLASELRKWFLRDSEIAQEAFEDSLRRLVQKLFSDWISSHTQEIEALFNELIQGENTPLENLVDRISRIPADVLAEEQRADHSLARPIDTRPLFFREIAILLDDLTIPWWYDLIPKGRPKELFSRHWQKKIPELVRRYHNSAYGVLESAAEDWIADLDRQFKTRIESTSSQIVTLLREEYSADLGEIQQITGRIQSFAETVRHMGTDGTQLSPLTSAGADNSSRGRSRSRCSICLRLERTLWDFLARSQYDLSVSETDQRKHAMRAGFCPLHTWQYETVSSPQGVCAAYPEVLAHFAAMLRTLAEESNSVDSMHDRMQSILPSQDSCAACELIASDERAAADEIARRVSVDDSAAPPLCTFHLRTVLGAKPGLDKARRLLLAQAQAFDDLAEDMENYVLKHTAVRHHLTTKAETQAAVVGLSRLVGSQRIAAPWRIE